MLAQRIKVLLILSLTTALYVALSVFIVEQTLQSEQLKHTNAATNTLNLELLSAKNTLESAIILDTYVGSSIATLATVAPEVVIDNWLTIGRQFVESAKYAKSVALAPNDVLGFVYPIAGNEKAVGLDLRTVPEQYHIVLQARERKQVMIAGPVSLVQGGLGIIVRYPVFSDFPVNQQYWGNVSVVINFDKLIDRTGLKDIDGATVAIRGRHASGADGEVFFGEPDTFDAPDVSVPIILPSGSWQLAAKYSPAALRYSSTTQTVIRATMYAVALCCYAALFLLVISYRRSRSHAYSDALTGLANRRLMLQKLDELQAIPTEKAHFALLNIDLNGFKVVNDNYGHEAGDALLRFVGEQLKYLLRSSDVVGRMGGDEFLVILHRIDSLETAETQASKVIMHFATHPLRWHNHSFTASLSIGAVHCQEAPGDIKALLTLADKRMYQQKKGELEFVI